MVENQPKNTRKCSGNKYLEVTEKVYSVILLHQGMHHIIAFKLSSRIMG